MAADTQYRSLPQEQEQQQQRPALYPDHAGLQVVPLDSQGLEVASPGSTHYPRPIDGLEVAPVEVAYGSHLHQSEYNKPSPVGTNQYWTSHAEKAAVADYPHAPYKAHAGYGSEYAHSQHAGSTHGGAATAFGPSLHPPPLPPQPPAHETTGGGDGGDDQGPKTVCGVRKNVFLIIVAVAVLVGVIAIALGVGLSLGLRKPSGGGDGAPASTSTSTTTSPTSTRTTTYPAPRATGTTSPSLQISCPTNNEFLYQAGSSTSSRRRKFLVLCDRDYGSQSGAVEMFNQPVATFSGCLDKCSDNVGCKAVGWGNYFGNLTCWLKSDIGTPHDAPAWYFAVGEEILAASASKRRRSGLPF